MRILLPVLGLVAACDTRSPPSGVPAEGADSGPACVGSARCVTCHPAPTQRWQESDHARAIAGADGSAADPLQRDVLHWTGPALNWNHMCADCHSTHVQKGWRADAGRFETTYAEVNVACEASEGARGR